ncbi:MAG: protein kinase, partial [Ignavibacteria bacterium]|nr:protein kinase [Ignavibacteria bacterium]
MNSKDSKYLFNKFEILETLKKDVQTGVYLANHVFLGKTIILKTLDTQTAADESILERFKREAKILAKLDHPNIIRVLDFGTFENFFYISFEYFRADNLREYTRKTTLSFDQKKNLFVQLLKGLKEAHRHQIIHRDIKPENILVNEKLELKLADFGLALMENENLVTSKTSIVGTPSYMSPEQIRGEKLDFQSDLFSAGIVAYELFLGINPFLKPDVASTINEIINYNESIFENTSSLPEDIRTILINLLQKSKSKRYKSADEVLQLLRIEDKVVEIKKSKLKSDSKKYIAFAVVLLILITTVFLFTWLKNSTREVVMNTPINVDSSMNEKIAQKENFIPTQEKIQPKDEMVKVEAQLEEKKKDRELHDVPLIQTNQLPSPSKLFIECLPWANVYVNSKFIEETPLKEALSLNAGEYELKLVHPEYPPYIQKINLKGNEELKIKVNLDTLIGYLECNLNPWGQIFVDGEFKGETPLQKAIKLAPGIHNIVLKNPLFGSYEEKIIIESISPPTTVTIERPDLCPR